MSKSMAVVGMWRNVSRASREVVRNGYVAGPAFGAPTLFGVRSLRTTGVRFGIDRAVAESTIVKLMKNFDRVEASMVTADAHFVNDLKLDSLDTVEILMEVEEHFNIEMPETDADRLKTVKDTIDYIADHPDATLPPPKAEGEASE